MFAASPIAAADVLPEATRIRLFGHAAVNRQHYTAVTSTEAVLSPAASLINVTATPGMPRESAGSAG